MALVESPHVVSSVKLPILKKVIMNGDEPVQTTKDKNGVETEVPPKTAQTLLQRQRERKAKSILLLAILDEYQLRFHGIKDGKTLWAAIKSRFGDDLYQFNFKVFEADIKSLSGSSSNSQNVVFLSAEDTNNINEVNIANSVFTASGHNSQGQASSSSYTDDLMFLLFANQSNSPQLEDEDLEQIDHDDLEEMDLKWECRAPRNQGNKNGDAGYRSRDNTRRIVPIETSDALVVQDNALIFDEQRQTLNKANLEIVAYQLGLESLEAQLIVHQKNEAVYEEKIAVFEFEVKDKGNAVTRLTNQLEQTLKEKEDLKAKLEQFETSSKNLNKLINSQLSTKDKTGLGYGDQLNESDSEVINSVFDSRSSDGDDNQTNDRFKKGNEYHAVPPPLTGNYMPPLADLSFAGLDDSVYTPTSNKASASISNGEESVTQTSNFNVEMPKDNSVRTNKVLIEDWVSDDEDIFQSEDSQTTVKPSFKKIEFTKARNEPVKSDKQAVKPRMVTQSPKVDRKDWNGKMTQKLRLGFGFTKKACFVYGSYNHLIKDCDFHEKRMAKKSVLKNMEKNTGQREIRPVWNNVQRINHENKFVPSAVLTRSGRVPVSTAKKSSLRATTSTSTLRPVNTATIQKE
ncbi:hypothetical protein Tco_1154950 [Tanacetum coccineum]